MLQEVAEGLAQINEVDVAPPPPTVRERRAKRYRDELSNGDPTEIEALADTLSAVITEVEDLRQKGLDLVEDLKTNHGINIHPNLFGDMTPNLAERVAKIAVIQAEEI